MKGKKAQQTFSIFTYMITIFLVVVLFASLIWTMGKINTVMENVGLQNDRNANKELYVNLTQASQKTFGMVNHSIQALKMVALVYILSLGVIIVLTNALQSKHPIWFIVYIFITVLAVIFAPLISNAYETLLNENVMEGTLSSFTASNYIILNLPVFILIIGMLGGIFLFINLIRTSDGRDEFGRIQL